MFVLVILGEGLTLRSYSLYVVCGALIVYNLLPLNRAHGKLVINTELVLLFSFLVYSGLSYFWAMDTSLVLYRLKILFFLTFLVFVMTSQMFRIGGFYSFLKLYFVMGIILSFACIVYFRPTGVINLIITGNRLGEDNALFMGINANTIALDCATAGILAVFYSLIKQKKIYLFSLIPILIIVVATGSRKGIFMLLIGIICVVYVYQRYKDTNIYSTLLKALVSILIVFVVFRFVLQLPGLEKINEQYMGFINSLIGKSEQADLSTLSRARMVTVGLQQFARKPILGTGLDNGKVINLMYNNFSAYLHNNYIEILVNGGLFGFVLYYSFFAILLVKHLKRFKEKNPFVYISLILLIIRLISDWGRVSYYDYMSIMLYSFWIAIANGYDLKFPNEIKQIEENI